MSGAASGISLLANAVNQNTICYPADSEQGISVHFFRVDQTEASTLTGEELADLIRAAEKGEFMDEPVDRLAQGPSYIELGGWIGSQQIALQLLGLGTILKIWQVITPKTLSIEGKQADDMAGNGFVMLAPVTDSPLFTKVIEE